MMLYIVIVGIALIILERIIPDQKLPHVKGWWTRVVIINVIQLGVLFVGKYTWDRWFESASYFHLSRYVNEPLGGFIAYLVITFVFYWWHRWRHTIYFLWITMHQVHHSPQRIETITSFYKHPLEIILNSIIMGSVNCLFLGLTLDSAAWCILYSAIGEYFYHMNISTPHWLGYIFQRPEMHRIHHERGKHFSNFSDLPLWDMLFGTFKNPKVMDGRCGFKPEREEKLFDMLVFKDVNEPYKGGGRK